jgi:hypothetical protein
MRGQLSALKKLGKTGAVLTGKLAMVELAGEPRLSRRRGIAGEQKPFRRIFAP